MCSSMLLVVQSTIVTASIVRGSAPRPITISLVRARSWARAVPAPASARATARASSAFRGRIEPPWASSEDQGYNQSGSVELVECEPEARHEGLQEVADFREVDPLHSRPQGLFRLSKLRVAGGDLLEALDVGAQLVRGAHELAVDAVRLARREVWLVVGPERAGDHPEELLPGRGLDRVVGPLDLGVERLDRRGQVAGEDLARVVVERQRHGSLGVDAAVEEPVLDDRERVGDLRDAQAVLLDVLGVRAVHEPPAADELHPGQVREEVARHAAGSDSELWVQRVAEPVAEQVDAERREGERRARERGEPPRDVEKIAALGQHAAPG